MENVVITADRLSKHYHSVNLKVPQRIDALSQVSFQVEQGERICLIGSNGSGKSTLLGLLGGVIKPSSGRAVLKGSVISILDIGASFIQDLTGRSNAELYIQLNGFSRKRNSDMVERIKLFSGLEGAFEYPIKTYSKGMQLRLAFATAFYGEADIYLIDEVMNVGDEAFRHKIQLFFDQLITQNKTIMLATHNKQEVMGFSTKCIWIEQGAIRDINEPQLIIPEYSKFQRLRFETEAEQQETPDLRRAKIFLPPDDTDTLQLNFEQEEYANEHLVLNSITVAGENQNGKIDRSAPVRIIITLYKKEPGYSLSVSMKIRDEFDTPVFYLLSIANQRNEQQDREITTNHQGVLTFECVIPANLLSTGQYFVSLWVGKNSDPEQPLYNERAYFFPDQFAFRVSSSKPQFISEPVHYPVQPVFEWSIKKSI